MSAGLTRQRSDKRRDDLSEAMQYHMNQKILHGYGYEIIDASDPSCFRCIRAEQVKSSQSLRHMHVIPRTVSTPIKTDIEDAAWGELGDWLSTNTGGRAGTALVIVSALDGITSGPVRDFADLCFRFNSELHKHALRIKRLSFVTKEALQLRSTACVVSEAAGQITVVCFADGFILPDTVRRASLAPPSLPYAAEAADGGAAVNSCSPASSLAASAARLADIITGAILEAPIDLRRPLLDSVLLTSSSSTSKGSPAGRDGSSSAPAFHACDDSRPLLAAALFDAVRRTGRVMLREPRVFIGGGLGPHHEQRHRGARGPGSLSHERGVGAFFARSRRRGAPFGRLCGRPR